MRIDCISDVHGQYPKMKGGDILIVAGDLTARHTALEYSVFNDWIGLQDYKKKIVIAGNHDPLMQNGLFLVRHHYEYLQDFGTEYKGLKIWGSPWTRRFEGVNPDCAAFMLDTEEELAKKWALIPDDTDILVTHSPPFGIRDKVQSIWKCGERVGSMTLLQRVGDIKPKLHVFGHIHGGYGKEVRAGTDRPGTNTGEIIFVNAAHMNESYEPLNNPIRIHL
jgi:Icc-related predicted phosphoesterase